MTGDPPPLVIYGPDVSQPPVKIAPGIPITAEMFTDVIGSQRAVEAMIHRYTHPWEYPDRNPFPRIDPVPWFTSRLLRYRAWRQRITDAGEVLRYGLDDVAADRDW